MLYFLLAASAVLGRFLLVWKQRSLGGYFGPRGNEPGIFKYSAGILIVWTLGHLFLWVPLLSLILSGQWLLSTLTLILAFSLAKPIFNFLHRDSLSPRYSFQSPPRDSPEGTEPLTQPTSVKELTRSQPTPERQLKYNLDELRAGVSVDRAIELLVNACNKRDTMFITDHWIEPRLTILRTHLADPITADEANALRGSIFETFRFDDVLDWLETSDLSWDEYRAHEAKLKQDAERE